MAAPALDIMMLSLQHHDVRTTLTLEPDVFRRLKAEERRTNQSFKDVVNDVLRRGLAMNTQQRASTSAFTVAVHRSGGLRAPFSSLDNVADVLDQIDEVDAEDGHVPDRR